MLLQLPGSIQNYKTAIGVIYRPPGSNLSLFNEEIENTIRVLCKPKTNLFFMEDYNINLLNHEAHADTGEFLNLLYANTMLPMITRPTIGMLNLAPL